MTPQIIRIKDPILDKSGRKHYKILTEDSFKELVIEEKLSRDELKKIGVSSHVMYASFRVHGKKYENELIQAKAKKISNALKGNKHGVREKPSILIDVNTLNTLIQKGMSIPKIAKECNTSEWNIRKNIEYFSISILGNLPNILQDTDEYYLNELERLSPGLKESTYRYYSNPEEFFTKLYTAYGKLNELIWFVKDLVPSYSSFRERGKISKNHICWSSNQYELRFSNALLDLKIEHIRQYTLEENLLLDFYLPKNKIAVEIDGEYHNQEGTKKRDKKKEDLCKQKGIKLIRFTTKQIIKDIANCLDQINKQNEN